jgi:hypothetical protein
MATSVIHRISVHPTAGTTPPAVPALGSNYDYATLQAAGWVTIGSVDLGDDCNLDSESIGQVPRFEATEILPPGSLTCNDTIVRHNGIDEITFTAYDVSQDVVELDSTASVDGVQVTRDRNVTYRSVLIEITGLRADYYPRVLLRVANEPGGFGPGDDAVCKTEFVGKVHNYTTDHGAYNEDVPTGRVQTYYVEGT